MVLLEKVRVGAKVKVRKDHRKPQLRGMVGTVEERWGNPDYHTALLVRLEDGRYEIFWHHELGEPEKEPPTTGRF